LSYGDIPVWRSFAALRMTKKSAQMTKKNAGWPERAGVEARPFRKTEARRCNGYSFFL
jgi:hypothetical protein